MRYMEAPHAGVLAMTDNYCSNCKKHHPMTDFMQDFRIMKTCVTCRTIKKPPVGKKKKSEARPPQSVIEFNRLWTPTRI